MLKTWYKSIFKYFRCSFIDQYYLDIERNQCINQYYNYFILILATYRKCYEIRKHIYLFLNGKTKLPSDCVFFSNAIRFRFIFYAKLTNNSSTENRTNIRWTSVDKYLSDSCQTHYSSIRILLERRKGKMTYFWRTALPYDVG